MFIMLVSVPFEVEFSLLVSIKQSKEKICEETSETGSDIEKNF